MSVTSNELKTDYNNQDNENTTETSKAENDISNTNLIINYLPSSLTQEKFYSLFNAIGSIKSCRLMVDKHTGQSIGYGFVDFTNPQDAQYAIDILDGLKLENKTIKVSYARPSSDDIKYTNLYVCGLPKPMTQNEFEELFSPYGKIITSRILYDAIPFSYNQEISVSKGIGFIRYSQRKEAELAIEKLNGTKVQGGVEQLIVKFANEPRNKQDFTNEQAVSSGSFRQNTNMFPGSRNDMNNVYSVNNNDNFERMGGPTGPIHHQNNRNRFSPITNDAMCPPPTGKNNSYWSIYISNLAPDTEENELWKLFGPFGAVSNVTVILDKETNKCKGIAFVKMLRYEEALVAIQSLNGTKLGERILQVRFKAASNRGKNSSVKTD